MRGEELHLLVKFHLPYLQGDGFFGTADLQRVFQMWHGFCTRKLETKGFCATVCFRFQGILLVFKSFFWHSSENMTNGTKCWHKTLYSQDKP